MRYRYTAQNYRCKQDHVSEFIVEDRERLKTRKCKKCGKKAEHVRVAATIAALPKSTVVYEKPGEDGKMRRMYVNPQEPASIGHAERQGFQRREIQGISAMRQFEREVTRDMKEEYAARMRGDHERKQEFDEAYHNDLRALASRSDLDGFTRDLIRAALEDQSGYTYREFDPNFYNAAYSG
jgi:hypothetical protein